MTGAVRTKFSSDSFADRIHLRRSERARFMRDGALVVRRVFDPACVSAWRQEVQAHFESPKKAIEWRHAVQNIKHSRFHLRDDPKPAVNARVSGLYEQLYGAANWHGINELVVTPPEPETPWLGGRAPHLDFPLGCPERNLLNIVFYLDEVRSRGAAFAYWPGSHQVAYQYFRRHPDDYLARGENSQDKIFASIKREIDTPMVEFTAKPGDVLLWSSFLMHSATVNRSDRARIAIIGRWGDLPSDPKRHFDFDAPLFHDWACSR
ncbi:MAG: phytanoyl-CoA dioxygenase family protein [Wenzhouxiangellaceae bacterium]